MKNKILLIEDDRAVAESLIDGLQREGYQVEWQSTGQRWDRPCGVPFYSS